jgi:ribosome biogenesis GTPase
LVLNCQFSDCSHYDEPDCAVRAAVENGKVHPERYESYLRIRFGED